MKRSRLFLAVASAVAVIGLSVGPAYANNGHFANSGGNAATCRDNGTTVTCVGLVVGLGGDPFEITIDADGKALIDCINNGGRVAPGQKTDLSVSGTTGPLTTFLGLSRFSVTTDKPPPVPNVPTCKNRTWTAVITDVIFTDATLTLFEDGQQVDQIVVAVS